MVGTLNIQIGQILRIKKYVSEDGDISQTIVDHPCVVIGRRRSGLENIIRFCNLTSFNSKPIQRSPVPESRRARYIAIYPREPNPYHSTPLQLQLENDARTYKPSYVNTELIVELPDRYFCPFQPRKAGNLSVVRLDAASINALQLALPSTTPVSTPKVRPSVLYLRRLETSSAPLAQSSHVGPITESGNSSRATITTDPVEPAAHTERAVISSGSRRLGRSSSTDPLLPIHRHIAKDGDNSPKPRLSHATTWVALIVFILLVFGLGFAYRPTRFLTKQSSIGAMLRNACRASRYQGLAGILKACFTFAYGM